MSKKNLGYYLYLVSRAHHNRANQVFSKIGLFRGQVPVLFELGRGDGITQSELSIRMELTQATLTNMLHRMESAALIERVRDAQDARFTRVYLTPHGRDTLLQAQELGDKIEQAAIAGFTNEEQQVLKGFLERIHANLTT